MLRGGISCLGNLSLLSTCTQIPSIVTQRLHTFDIDRQLTIFRVTQRSPIIAHVNMYANRFYRHTTFPYCRHRQATNYVLLLSLMRTCMQTTFIVTQRLPIVDIGRQPTIFSVTQCFPIIAHVNMHPNSFSRHTTSPCYRSRQHGTIVVMYVYALTRLYQHARIRQQEQQHALASDRYMQHARETRGHFRTSGWSECIEIQN